VRVKVAAAVCALTACLAFAGAAAADPQPSTSSNWSGYAIADPDTIAGNTTSSPFSFSNATATWRQPKATCVRGHAAFAAFWVGLGGYADGSPGLEQVGTDSDCSSTGTPTYFAWYELVPAPSTRLSLKVRPGDTITAAVVVNGNDVLLQLKNRTRHTSVTKNLFMNTPDVSSAEWIAEAPADCFTQTRCKVLPLADFGSVAFTNIAATGSGHAGTLTDPTWTSTAISLVPDSSNGADGAGVLAGSSAPSSTAGARPGAPSSDGRAFSVGWVRNALG
jgi:hypothetical protein